MPTINNFQKQSKKITDRRLYKKANKFSDMLMALMNQISFDGETNKELLSPVRRADGRYVTSEANLDKWIDPRIFRETQIKRLFRWLTTIFVLNIFFNWLFVKNMQMKLHYFDNAEDKHLDKIYAQGSENEISTKESKQFTVHNLGHATQLIQTSGMSILTDPVFGDLAPIVYPSMTKSFGKNYKPEDLPAIDVIIITHNHRDHVDVASLKKLIKIAREASRPLPQLLVPVGDKEFFRELGFTDVRAFEWHEAITLYSENDEPVTFCGVPADHRSGRTGHDSHKSLVMGWTISPKNKDEILYFAGDTARISNVRMNSLAVDIYQLYCHKKELKGNELPKIINMEPGGPNYTRKDMQATHQSAIDSIASAFRLAVSLHHVNAIDQENAAASAENWLNATATVFMHQNKYELGPDRFNENVFIFNRLLSYLKMTPQELDLHAKKQAEKSNSWSLFHRRKDFIIDGVKELRELAEQIWPSQTKHEQNESIIKFIESRVHFPLINEKLTTDDFFKFKAGERSTIRPDTNIIDKKTGNKKCKGSKDENVKEVQFNI